MLALGLFAGGMFVVGAYSLLGRPGLALGALLLMVGNSRAPRALRNCCLRAGARWDSYFPPGAMTSLLRSVGYFDGAAALQPALVLIGWVVFGLVLVGLAGRRTAPGRPDALVAA